MQVRLGEKLLFAGEKKLNREALGGTERRLVGEAAAADGAVI